MDVSVTLFDTLVSLGQETVSVLQTAPVWAWEQSMFNGDLLVEKPEGFHAGTLIYSQAVPLQ